MMDEIRIYLLRIIAAAILCSVVTSLCNASKFSSLIRMILGIVMAISVLQPILNIDVSRLSMNIQSITDGGETIITQGRETAQRALSAIVSEGIGEYIEEKARQLGADIAVHVDVKDGAPVGVFLEGDASPYIRSQLSAWILTEIGLEKEALNWH